MEDEERKWRVSLARAKRGSLQRTLLRSSQDRLTVILVSFQSNGRDIGSRLILRLSFICDQPSQNLLIQSEWIVVLMGLYSVDMF